MGKKPIKISQYKPSTQVTFTRLTKDFLESKDEDSQEAGKQMEEMEDEELRLHEILKKWKAGDRSTTTTPSIRLGEPKKDAPDPKLESGMKLASRIKIDDSFLGIPLTEIDPYYRPFKSTFVVIGRDRNLTRFSATDALFTFSPFNPVRRAALYILVHPIFSLLVILTILCNCVFMAMTSPPEIAEYVFTAVYTLEALIKILARGFFLAPFTYIRDAWNILDFVVITLAYITSFVNLGNLSILRTFRVLRALKTVAIVPGLKTIVGALLEAVRRLRDVAFLTLFMLSIFALIGLQLYMGQLGNKCVLRPPRPVANDTLNETAIATTNTSINESPFVTTLLARKRRGFVIGYINPNFSLHHHPEYDPSATRDEATLFSLSSGIREGEQQLVIPSEVADDYEENSDIPRIEHGTHVGTADTEWIHNPENWLDDPEIGYAVCGAFKCPENYMCVPHIGDNPDFGFTSFDNYGWAMFAGFRLMTQDCWERLFHQVITASGTLHVIYFLLVIFLGSFYLINLILAIVAMSYQDLQTQESADAAQEREEAEAERLMADAGDVTIDNTDLQTPHRIAGSLDGDAEISEIPELDPDQFTEPGAINLPLAVIRRKEFASKLARSLDLPDQATPSGSIKQQGRRKLLDRQVQSFSRRSSINSYDLGEPPRPPSRQLSRNVSPSAVRRRQSLTAGLGGTSRVSFPYCDDSGAVTPTSEMLDNSAFHISEYIAALQKLNADAQAELQQPPTPSSASTTRPRAHAGSVDTRTVVQVESNAHLLPWRLAALRRGSLSIDDETIGAGPPDLLMAGLRAQLARHIQPRALEKRPPVDDAASILAIDVFSATPQRYRRIAFPMMDDTISRLVESACSSRISLHTEQVQVEPTADKKTMDEQFPEKLIKGEIVVVETEEVPDGEGSETDRIEECPFPKLTRCWNSRSRRLFEMVVNDPFVDLFITLCIVVNTLFMALDHHGMSPTFEEHLRQGNYFFTAVFATESVLKIVAFSPCRYFTDPWNVFDSFIVFLSLVELGLEGVQGLSVLRTFRLLRVFKLARSWPTLNLLIGIIGRTLGALGNLTFVLGIIVFIFAVMGMQLFGKAYRQNISRFPDGELPRWHFEDFTHSFMIVFRVLCGEWVESTWDCMLVFGWPCIPFFVLTLVVGNLVVLNLFLALLLDSFSSENIQSIMGEKSNEPNKLAEAIDRITRSFNFVKLKIINLLRVKLAEKKRRRKVQTVPEDVAMEPRRGAIFIVGDVDSTPTNISKSDMENADKPHGVVIELPHECSEPAISMHSHVSIEVPASPQRQQQQQIIMGRSSTLPSIRPRVVSITPHLSRLRAISAVSNVADCCPPWCYRRFKFINRIVDTPAGLTFMKFRQGASKLIEHKYFESIVITLIIISSMALAIEDVNTRQNKTLMSVLDVMDKCFTVIFAVEMCLKWLALGFRRYFSDGWCWLDFVIVAVSLISWAAEGAGLGNLGAFRALRTLRALRPLRAVSRWEGMKIVVNALLQAIPSICNVFLVCVVFWLIFSIMGVQLFAGKFHKCVDGEGNRLAVETVANKTECLLQNYTWSNSKINFDNVGRAYLSLFQVATFSGWIEIIADAVDAVEVDQQPYREASVYFYFYFVLFIIFGSFFTLNLFIGVIIENFNKQKKRSGGSIEMFMTDEQKKYYNAIKKLKHKSPQKPIPKPKNWLHAKLFTTVTDQRFDIFIMVVIMLNMLQMCLEHHDEPDLFTTVLSYTNSIFVAIFTGEFVLKLIAFRCYYFTQPWNVFDCVVVILSIVASALADYMADFPVSPTILRVIRVFRVGRILRLVKSAKGIRTLLFSLAVSLPALFNIGLLLLLVIFIYACFGMSFFMNVRLIEGLDEQFNFQTIINSMLLLFQLATSAGWDTVMLALLNDSPPECDPSPTEFSPNGDCSSTMVAVIYLVSYIIISFMIVINMYIAVILENFGEATQDIQQGLTQDDFDAFFEKWESVDPEATQYIPVGKLSEFVASLEPPLTIPKPNWRAIVILDPPVCTNLRIHCDDIVTMLVRNAVAGSVSNAADTPELDLADILSKEKPDYEVIASLSQLDSAARRIQRKWRRRRRAIRRSIRSRPDTAHRGGTTLAMLIEHQMTPAQDDVFTGGNVIDETAVAAHHIVAGDIESIDASSCQGSLNIAAFLKEDTTKKS